MKKLHLSLKNEINSIKEFDEQQYQEIEEIINHFILSSKMKWAYEVIRRNFNILIGSAESEFKQLSNSDLLWEKLELASLEINRNVLNYLDSLNTFLDHTKKFLSKKFGKNSEEDKKFTKMTQRFVR